MKLLKLKLVIGVMSLFTVLFGVLFCVTLFFSDEEESSNSADSLAGLNVSADVLAHKQTVEKYCKEYGISEYVSHILAIMQVESGGKGQDVMQSSESLGLAPNTLSTEASIKQGCKYFSELLSSAKEKGIEDINATIQSYN